MTRKLCPFFRAAFLVFQRRFTRKNQTPAPRRTIAKKPATAPTAAVPDDADAAAAANPGVAVEDAVWDSVRLDDPDLVLVRVCVGNWDRETAGVWVGVQEGLGETDGVSDGLRVLERV